MAITSNSNTSTTFPVSNIAIIAISVTVFFILVGVARRYQVNRALRDAATRRQQWQQSQQQTRPVVVVVPPNQQHVPPQYAYPSLQPSVYNGPVNFPVPHQPQRIDPLHQSPSLQVHNPSPHQGSTPHSTLPRRNDTISQVSTYRPTSAGDNPSLASNSYRTEGHASTAGNAQEAAIPFPEPNVNHLQRNDIPASAHRQNQSSSGSGGLLHPDLVPYPPQLNVQSGSSGQPGDVHPSGNNALAPQFLTPSDAPPAYSSEPAGSQGAPGSAGNVASQYGDRK